MPVSARAADGSRARRRHGKPNAPRAPPITINLRHLSLVRPDIYHLAIAIPKGKSCLAAGNFCPERKPPDSTLELIDDAEPSVRVGARVREGLPTPAVVNQQLHNDALRRNWPEHAPAESDRALRARSARAHAELHARSNRLQDFRRHRVRHVSRERGRADLDHPRRTTRPK